MGNTCDFTPPPVQWWRDWREKVRTDALKRLITEHVKTEKFFEAQIAVLRMARREFEIKRQDLKELCGEKKQPSQEVIDECFYFTSQIAMCSSKIKAIRTKLLGTTKQRTELQTTGYSRLIQKGWKRIVAEYKKIDIDFEELENDGEEAAEAMEDFKAFNEEADAIGTGVFAVTADSEEEKERIKKESMAFLGLEYVRPKRVAATARSGPATTATAAAAREEQEKLLPSSVAKMMSLS